MIPYVILFLFIEVTLCQLQAGASWPSGGGGTKRAGMAATTGPTDSSVELKWYYSNFDGSATGPQPVIDNNGNVYIITAGGSIKSLSTTSSTNPSPLFSGYQYNSAGGGSCLPISISTVAGNVFTYGVTTNYYSSIIVSGQAIYVAASGTCTGTALTASKVYYAIPLTATTFALSSSQTTLSPITISCSSLPTLVSLAPGPTLTSSIPIIMAAGTYVDASIPCTSSSSCLTVATATVLSGSTSASFSYTVSPLDSTGYTPTSVKSGNWSMVNTLVAGQPIWFSSNGTCTGGGGVFISSSTVYYVLNATSTFFFFSASLSGNAIIFSSCTVFPVLIPYTTSTGCLANGGASVTSSSTVAVSFTSTAPPTVNWVASLSGKVYTSTYAGITSTATLTNSVAGIPITATPALDSSGYLWLPVGNNVLPILASTGAVSTSFQPGCPINLCFPTSYFFAQISGTTLTLNSGYTLTATLTLASTTPSTGTLSVTSGSVPFLAPGSVLTTASGSVTVVVLSAVSCSTVATSFYVSVSPATSFPTATLWYATIAPFTHLSAPGLSAGTYIVSGYGSTYTISSSHTMANSTFTAVTGLPTSPLVDASGIVVFTCGSYIASCTLSGGCVGPYLWNQGYGLLSPLSYSSSTSLFYASDSGSSVWAWTAAQLSSSSATWTWPPSPWPSSYLARTNGLVAHFNAPVVGTASDGKEQVYVTRYSPLTAYNPLVPCSVHALSQSTTVSSQSTANFYGQDNWLYGTVSGSIQAGMPLTPCVPSQPSVIGPDKVALVCTSTLTSSGTLNIITSSSSQVSSISLSSYKFASSPLVDSSLSTLYLTGADGCVTGFSINSYTPAWSMPSGCSSSTSLSPFTTQPIMTGTTTSGGGNPGYVIVQDSSSVLYAYGRYGSATASPSSSATITRSTSISPSVTFTVSASVLSSVSPVVSFTVSASVPSSPTASVFPSPTASSEISKTVTLSPSVSFTTSISPSASPTSCSSNTLSLSASFLSTASLNTSASSSVSSTPTVSPSDLPTLSLFPSASNAPTPSYSLPPTLSNRGTFSPSPYPSDTATGTSSNSPTGTPSFTPWRNAIANGGTGSSSAPSGSALGDISALTGAGIALCVIGGLMIIGAVVATFYFNPAIRDAISEFLCGGSQRGGGSGKGGDNNGKGGKGGLSNSNSLGATGNTTLRSPPSQSLYALSNTPQYSSTAEPTPGTLRSSMRSSTGARGGELEDLSLSTSSSRSSSRGRSSSSSRAQRGDSTLDVSPDGEIGEGESPAAATTVRSPSALRRGSYSARRNKGSSSSSNPYADWTQNAED